MRRFGIAAVLPVLLVLFLSAGMLFAGGSRENEGDEAPAATAAPAAEEAEAAEEITLTMYHWFGPEVRETIEEINRRFSEKYPGTTVEYESAPTDMYRNIIKVKLASGDAPDIFGVFPGTEVVEYSAAGHLMDLSDEPFIERFMDGSLQVTRGEDGKVYSLPVDQNVIGAVYNRDIFEKAGVEVPETWNELLAVCEKIKAAGYYPLALGNADLWVTQLLPYALVPGMVYADTPNFDQLVYEGKKKFNSPGWSKVLERYIELDEAGYFQPGVLSTTYDQTIQLMAMGKAAMVVNGNWIIAGIREANPDLDLGMFAFPSAATSSDESWISAAVGITIAGYRDTEHPERVKDYLEFWSEPEIVSLYLNAKKAFPTVRGIEVDFDPAANEISKVLAKSNTAPFPDQNWPSGVQDVFLKGYQSLFSGAMTIPEVLDSVDEEWVKRTAE